uniref:KAP NTPase domain-containing protein n=1 Tax=Tanacetum cinerariifolium TaxID=118510 RepID=A0A699GKI7_TANCI|nr:hypothetical protein [Tanacetum cinerariifolium]
MALPARPRIEHVVSVHSRTKKLRAPARGQRASTAARCRSDTAGHYAQRCSTAGTYLPPQCELHAIARCSGWPLALANPLEEVMSHKPENGPAHTSPKVASTAGKQLSDKKSGAAEKSVAGSALTQAPDKGKAKNEWDDDFLNRRDEANYLSEYLAARYHVKKNERGFVLAINGDWGLGKSFLIDRWSSDLKKSGHPVIMFNSWENDFTTEPLVAFISELNSALDIYFSKMPQGQIILKSWLNQAKAVLVPTLKVVGLAALKHGAGVGMQELNTYVLGTGENEHKEIVDIDTKEIAEKLEKVIEEELKSHVNVKKSIQNFKTILSDLVNFLEDQAGTQLPIFIFIDELDRCRPDYAIKLLEGIKHLFGIPGIHFIVATNLSELAHSIRAVYGEQFGAERYLKRFFDMEYSLPEPEGIEFAAELMTPISQLTNANFIIGMESTLHADAYPAKNLSYVFLRYALAFDLRLRDQQQAAKILEAALLTLGNSPEKKCMVSPET